MPKICERCGKSNNPWIGDPLYLDGDKILCCKCAEPVREDLNKLFYIKTKEEFEAVKSSIVKNCNENYDDRITDYINSVVSERSRNYTFATEDSQVENIGIPDTIRKATDSEENSGDLFNNIGNKIKTLAQIVTWVGIIGSVISGMCIASIDEDLIVLGVLVAILGSLVSWVSSFLLYGYGQMIENTDKIVRLLKK